MADTHPLQRARSDLSPGLKAGALGGGIVLMQAVTAIGPAGGLFFNLQYQTSLTGLTTPLTASVGLLIILMAGFGLAELAKALPSAGGYFTYLSRTVHPRAGWMTSWIYFLYAPLTAALVLAFSGDIVDHAIDAEWGLSIPWPVWLLVGACAIAFTMFRGITISGRVLLMLGMAEIAIVLFVAMAGVIDPGDGGVNLQPFDPGNATSANGFFLSVVFSVLLFAGWETAAPLGEETDNPRRNIGRAIVGSVLILGGFQIFNFWAYLIGFGTDDLSGFISSAENPVFVVGQNVLGDAWVILLLALLNGSFAVALAFSNAATRMWFAMGRGGAFPAALGRIHPSRQTPMVAVALQTIITVGFGLVGGAILGPQDLFFLFGLAGTLSLLFTYSMGNIGVFRFYRRQGSTRFQVVRHAIFPAVSTIAFGVVAYKSLNPLPPNPVGLAVYFFVGWLALGISLLAIMRQVGREDWMLKAGETVAEVEEGGPQGLEGRPYSRSRDESEASAP